VLVARIPWLGCGCPGSGAVVGDGEWAVSWSMQYVVLSLGGHLRR